MGTVMAEIKLKGRSFDQTRRLVSDALKVQYPNASWVWIKDDGLHADTVIFTVEMATGNPRKQTYFASYTIDKSNVVTLSNIKLAQIKQTVEIASFSVEVPEFTEADFAAGGDEIVKPCLLFKAGDYTKTKGINVSIQDLDEIVIPNFMNVGIEDEHPLLKGRRKPSKWSGKIGRVIKTWREGDVLYGDIAFSKWVGEAFKGEKPSLSISLDPSTKKPREVSLVDDPYIAEAGVLSAFSVDADEPEEGRSGKPMSVIARIIDKLGFSKAEEDELRAEFSSNTDLKAQLDSAMADLKAKDAKIASLEQGVSSFSISRSAEALAKAHLLDAKKILPADFSGWVETFADALLKDGANFSADTSATKRLERLAASMPVLDIYKEADFGSFSMVPMGASSEAPKFKDSSEVMNQLNGGGK